MKFGHSCLRAPKMRQACRLDAADRLILEGLVAEALGLGWRRLQSKTLHLEPKSMQNMARNHTNEPKRQLCYNVTHSGGPDVYVTSFGAPGMFSLFFMYCYA